MRFDTRRFVEACEQRGLNVTQIAAELGVREATVVNWFKGVGAPGGASALQLVDLLKVRPRDLLVEEEVVKASA